MTAESTELQDVLAAFQSLVEAGSSLQPPSTAEGKCEPAALSAALLRVMLCLKCSPRFSECVFSLQYY